MAEIVKEIFPSDFDGLLLEMETIVPEGPVKGIVQLSHGMAEHKERYEDFMMYLAEHGYVAVIHDHRGHGASVQTQEHFGYFYTEDSRGIVEDLHQVSVMIKSRYPGLPLYLFSHSMGTLVARNYLKLYDSEIDKLVLCGPPTENPLAPLALFLTKLSTVIQGEKHRNKLINYLAFHLYEAKFDAKSAWLSSDETVVEAFNNDPLCGFPFTNNGFSNLFQLLIGSFAKDGWKLENKSLPILMVAGAEDPVINSKKKFYQMKAFLKKTGYPHVYSKLYPGMRHEILNEKGKQAVYEDISKFFNSSARKL